MEPKLRVGPPARPVRKRSERRRQEEISRPGLSSIGTKYWGLDRKTDTVRGETLRNVVGGALCGRLAPRHGWPELQVCSSRVLPPVCGVRLSLVLDPSGCATSSWLDSDYPKSTPCSLDAFLSPWFPQKLSREECAWLCREEGTASRVAASMEALAMSLALRGFLPTGTRVPFVSVSVGLMQRVNSSATL